MTQGEKQPMTPDEMDKELKRLCERIDAIAQGWHNDVATLNRAIGQALEQMRSENKKLADRIRKLEIGPEVINE